MKKFVIQDRKGLYVACDTDKHTKNINYACVYYAKSKKKIRELESVSDNEIFEIETINKIKEK